MSLIIIQSKANHKCAVIDYKTGEVFAYNIDHLEALRYINIANKKNGTRDSSNCIIS